MPKKRDGTMCPGFAWIGQSWEHCDNCSQAAWDHDGMQHLKPDAGPFDCYADEWETRPWSDEIIGRWLQHGIIDRRRALELLKAE